MAGDLDFRLLNEFQRDLPLVARPYREIAARLGCDEARVLEGLARLRADGSVSRVGAVFAPGALGAGTLAALAVPPARLEDVAARVSARASVNHNYEREHHLNLWFVVTASSRAALDRELAAIADDTGIAPIALPLVEEYHIDLGFDLASTRRAFDVARAAARPVTDAAELRLAGALEAGLGLVSRPYAALAAAAGMDEAACLGCLRHWQDQGVVRRLGVIVRHRELGYVANAMAVWDVPDDAVSACGARLAAQPGVHLCYRRMRHLPHWPYNLFCMVHGREREGVEARIAAAAAAAGLDGHPGAVLFSTRRFKQTGARYLESRREPAEIVDG